MTTRLSFAVLFAIAALCTGCGSAGGGLRTTTLTPSRSPTRAASVSPAPAYPGGPAVVRLSESDSAITPANPRVTGTHLVSFEVTNNGSITHSFAVRTPFGVVKSDRIAPGQQGGVEVDLIRPGIYSFYCPLGDHRVKGMQGSVVVQSP